MQSVSQQLAVDYLSDYSGTSNKGSSEVGTASLKREGHLLWHHALEYYLPPKWDNLSTRDKIISPRVSLVRCFHCITHVINTHVY